MPNALLHNVGTRRLGCFTSTAQNCACCSDAARNRPQSQRRPLSGPSSRFFEKVSVHPSKNSLRQSGVVADAPEVATVYPIPERKRLEVDVGGRKIYLETGEVGRQANGAILASDGETVIYTTACCNNDKPTSYSDFVPLTVDYQEKFSAAGKTKGGFMKRDRAVDHEILTARLVDRSIRPLFMDGWVNETQVLEWVVSFDGEHLPEPLAITAAGAALAISDIPLAKAVAGVRVGWIEGEGPVVNPTLEQLENSKLDLLLAGTADAVIMIEGYADFLSEEDMMKAIDLGVKAVNSAADQIAKWAEQVGKQKLIDYLIPCPSSLVDTLDSFCGLELKEVFKEWEKKVRGAQMKEIWQRISKKFIERTEEGPESAEDQETYEAVYWKNAFKTLQSKIIRERVFSEGVRIDGRGVEEIRPISSRATILPRTHGSTLFTRGSTQALCVATLGGRKSAQRVNTIKVDDVHNFYLQYFFPPSCVGEVRRYGGMPGRRELGHGQLASRSLAAVVPHQDDFPYTIRVESTITESDGSSSMASVCGGCLAMLDAGVPIDRPAAGIAMGLILNKETGDFLVISDILGTEDALGDMDFKVAGDKDGITGFQMDMKVEGITVEVIEQAIAQAKRGRIHILGEMAKCSPPPRRELSKYAPVVSRRVIDPELISLVIGARGSTIKAITEESGVTTIDVNDEGLIEVEGDSKELVAKAEKMLDIITNKKKVGDIFRQGAVVKVASFGAFVQLAPGCDGMVHISEMAVGRVEKVEDVLKVGDLVDVQVISVESGRLALSMKSLITGEDVSKRREKPIDGGKQNGAAKSRGRGRGDSNRKPAGEGGRSSAYQKQRRRVPRNPGEEKPPTPPPSPPPVPLAAPPPRPSPEKGGESVEKP
ncbi:hypothetical protein BSKO_08191 [Bryopsis sp. KO-2023]|nr:hypothetical protein BSKO_08191 [Bryopsis sp. KO-2023]